MFLQPLDLTTALRPILYPDETLLFVQDAVGLYEGKFQIPNHQHGHAYLTSHRVCYVDNAEPRKYSVAIELRQVERYEFYAGFLKSSPKITLYPKPAKQTSTQNWGHPTIGKSLQIGTLSPITSSFPLSGSPFSTAPPSPSPTRPTSATWICPICSFSNSIPSNFDASTANAHTPLPPCSTCGIKPPLAYILKAAITSVSTRQASPASAQLLLESHNQNEIETNGRYDEPPVSSTTPVFSASSFQCPRCTFLNHPSLLSCEICGAALLSAEIPGAVLHEGGITRSESPGPSLDGGSRALHDLSECIKVSFRAGGEKIFHERLKGAMVQRKWLLRNAPPVPMPNQKSDQTLNSSTLDGLHARAPLERGKTVGIAGLERRGQELRKNNEVVIGNAFEDLEALMASAKEIVALAESFASKSSEGSSEANTILSESATALGMVTTKDMLGSNAGSDTLYLSELSRNLAEYLTDDAKGVLRREGGIMSLVDLWAVFNRARGDVELISPLDFEKAARLWEKLGLPVRLRQFKSGLLVVQRNDWTDDKTIAQLLAWLQEMHLKAPPFEAAWDWTMFGRGITPQEAAERFGWSIGVASEELEMAEEKGALCREEGVEGVRFWENWLVRGSHDSVRDSSVSESLGA
ncbi:MAG: vacuolar sorting [Lasallia pustulata]|uniref:Vacuolar protein-sorting-associated protein 36 n=1 Tax=Lasallia pustulata TaxID=136370 RepID=A0A5M8PZ58_9LECA|nr:MAG: vacuolar sorting [Lasallia pustulata]